MRPVLPDVQDPDDGRVVEDGRRPLARNRAAASGSRPRVAGSTLTATGRPWVVSSHRYTWPMPPEPIRSRTR